MNGLVIHVEAGEARLTEVISQDRIRIGTGPACDLRFRSELFPETPDVVLELARANGHFRVAAFPPALGLTHNDSPLTIGAEIADGDRVRLAANLELQFFPINAAPALIPKRRGDVLVAPFIEQAALDAAATSRRDDAKVFLREFTRELVREINPSTKVITLLIAVALVGGILYLGFAGFKELKQSRRQLEAQNERIAVLNDQMRQSQQQFEQVDRTNRGIINSLSLAPSVWSEYSAGVCLISGTYIFVEARTGRPLRYPETQTAAGTVAEEGAEQTPLLTPVGRGSVAEFPYVGTGFYVGGGYVVTNRHIAAEPWAADERSMIYGSTVSGQPRISKLVAYFPGQRQSFALRLKNTSRQDDLAVCLMDAAEKVPPIPALPLDENSDAAAVGKAVVLMGYPSGPDRILASLPEGDANTIKQRFGSSLDVLVGHLADRQLIKPLTTQGNITALEGHRIIYDARTAEGGSGAPLFGQSGRVIGVNFAIFTELDNANFAVPVRFAVALLERAGWKPSEPSETNTNGNANANARDSRPPTAANANQSK